MNTNRMDIFVKNKNITVGTQCTQDENIAKTRSLISFSPYPSKIVDSLSNILKSTSRLLPNAINLIFICLFPLAYNYFTYQKYK